MVATVLSYAIPTALLLGLAYRARQLRREAWEAAKGAYLDVVRGLSWRRYGIALVLLVGVVAASVLLLQLPWLRIGWWSLVTTSTGSPLAGPGDGSPVGAALSLALLSLVVALLPLLALQEEAMFRRGAERWSWPRRVRRAIYFGLLHALMGIPIGVALALSIGGIGFTAEYLREYRRTGDEYDAVDGAASLHLAYNTIPFGLAIVAAVVSLAV